MPDAALHRALGWIIGAISVLLVGLTLYTAYFGVLPDGLQRSGHLMMVMALVYIAALQTSLTSETGRRRCCRGSGSRWRLGRG